MTSYYKENHEATKEAEKAREKARELAVEALRYARQCKGEDVDPMIRILASSAGRLAAEARKEAKEKAAKAAEARRIACKRAMGTPEVPDFPSKSFNGGKMPTPPNRKGSV
jgi:hypothetical protein